MFSTDPHLLSVFSLLSLPQQGARGGTAKSSKSNKKTGRYSLYHNHQDSKKSQNHSETSPTPKSAPDAPDVCREEIYHKVLDGRGSLCTQAVEHPPPTWFTRHTPTTHHPHPVLYFFLIRYASSSLFLLQLPLLCKSHDRLCKGKLSNHLVMKYVAGTTLCVWFCSGWGPGIAHRIYGMEKERQIILEWHKILTCTMGKRVNCTELSILKYGDFTIIKGKKGLW